MGPPWPIFNSKNFINLTNDDVGYKNMSTNIFFITWTFAVLVAQKFDTFTSKGVIFTGSYFQPMMNSDLLPDAML